MSNPQGDITVYEKIRDTRKAERCTAVDYINNIFTDFTELHGDRCFGDDHAVIGGIGKICGEPVTVIGIEKGHTAYERMYHDFGCVLPEGYRKALRLMRGAEKFARPVVCFVDTQGANCGRGADYYSVISPESCASILYKDVTKAPEAAEHLKLTARDLYGFGVVERIVAEPSDFKDKAQVQAFMRDLQTELHKKIKALEKQDIEDLLANRYEKYRKIGSGENQSVHKKGGWLHRG